MEVATTPVPEIGRSSNFDANLQRFNLCCKDELKSFGLLVLNHWKIPNFCQNLILSQARRRDWCGRGTIGVDSTDA